MNDGWLVSGVMVDLDFERRGRQLISTLPESTRLEALQFKGRIRTILMGINVGSPPCYHSFWPS
jgi:hypothetical protein